MGRWLRHLLPVVATLIAGIGCPSVPRRPVPAFHFDEGLSGIRGVWHSVEPGETLTTLAARYDAEVEDIVEINDLRGEPTPGREVFVPTARIGSVAGGASVSATPRPGRVRPAALSSLIGCLSWPVEGGIVTSGFGIRRGKNHDGLDIAAESGARVRAAADGEVIYAASKLRGYGNMIVLRHTEELATVYAHNRANLVDEGDRVVRGHIIAEVGATGRATGPHVHFEVRVGDAPRNPRSYLPPECEVELADGH